MPIANLSALASKLTGGSSGNPQHPFFFFENRVAASSVAQTVVNRIRSLWTINKSNGAAGNVPASTTMTVCTSGTVGALQPFGTAGASGVYTYLGMDVGIGATSAGTYMIYDRLAHNAGIVHNVNTAQGCGNSSGEDVPVTRYASTVSSAADFAGGNQIWLETYTTWGASAGIGVVANYTNQAGTSGRLTPSVVHSSAVTAAGGIQVLPLSSGDTGVIAVKNVTYASSQGTAGSVGVTIARPLLQVPVVIAGHGVTRDTLSGLPALPRIQPTACLAFSMLALGAGDPNGFINCHFVDSS